VQILCHRGWWIRPEEKNSAVALRRAFDAGLGVETDLRDLAGNVVVSHDPPCCNKLDLVELLDLHADAPTTTLGLNIKADGLAAAVADALAEHAVMSSSFAFDMAVPDQHHWHRTNVAVFTRHSDVEPAPVLYDRSAGVWLDDFVGDGWWTATTVASHLDAAKRVAVVSPELHGRDPRDAWGVLRSAGLHERPGVLLCTDMPDEATAFFSMRCQ
jgi:hypothetical protein